MASINRDIYDSPLSNSSSDVVQVSIQLVIEKVIFSMIAILLITSFCVIWNECLVPSICFITILIFYRLSVARQMDVNDVTCLHVLLQFLKTFYNGSVCGYLIEQHIDCKPLFCQYG